MKNTNKFVAFIVALLMLVSATTAFAGTYVSDAVSPSISASSSGDAQTGSEATPEPEATLAPEASVEPTPAAEEIAAVVTTADENGSVNIRAAASSDSAIVGKLTSGMSVTVLGVEGDWVRVRAGDVVGYVYSAYLNIPEQAGPEVTPLPEVTLAPEVTLVPEVTPLPEATPAVEQQIVISSNRDVNTLLPGDTLTLSAQLIGFEGVSYSLQWQVMHPDGSWQDIDGATGTTMTINITEEHNGCSWRLQAKTVE